ncbi:MAG: MotA/TolQ/ExbB proton channel family protein [Candidatus Omnitrophica bacterium]|nr:MotA/TolQ/ExbB proton channel family protein [Candidatus Omnitrophota bacterium]
MIELIQKGGPVMIALLGASVLAVTFIVERLFWWFAQYREMPASVWESRMGLLREGGIGPFLDFCRTSKDPVARTFCRAARGTESIRPEILAAEADVTLQDSLKFLGLLDTVVTLSPLLGIFGTVTGIIRSFDLMGAQGISDPHAVSAGIAQALITTAAGLAVAMPSLVCHSFFVSKSERLAARLDRACAEFEIAAARPARKGTRPCEPVA